MRRVIASGRLLYALAGAGFRRYATYRQATVAGAFTNTVFGFVRCYVLLSLADAAGRVAGYDRAQLVTFVFVGQGMLAVVNFWGGQRPRRPGAHRGRHGRPAAPARPDGRLPRHRPGAGRPRDADAVRRARARRAARVRLLPAGASVDLPAVRRVAAAGRARCARCAATWSTSRRSGCWTSAARGSCGWSRPALAAGWPSRCRCCPTRSSPCCGCATPFPALMQAPLDVLVERGGTAHALVLIAGQLAWLAIVVGLARLVQRRALLRLVIQGG